MPKDKCADHTDHGPKVNHYSEKCPTNLEKLRFFKYHNFINQRRNEIKREKHIEKLQYDATHKLPRRVFYPTVNAISRIKLQRRIIQAIKHEPINATESENEELISEKLDTIRSGESLVKYYNFDTSKYNSGTDKCVAFWQAIMDAGIEPVQCASIKLSASESDASSDDSEEDSDSCVWYNTLLELQNRKMDEVALAASHQQCRLCRRGRDEPYSEFKKRQSRRYSKDGLRYDEDIICLNDWQSKPKLKLVDAATNVQNAESLGVILLSSEQEHDVLSEPSPLVDGQLEQDVCCRMCKCNGKFCYCEKPSCPKREDFYCSTCNCNRKFCQCEELDLPKALIVDETITHKQWKSSSSLDKQLGLRCSICKCTSPFCRCEESDLWNHPLHASSEVYTAVYLQNIEQQKSQLPQMKDMTFSNVQHAVTPSTCKSLESSKTVLKPDPSSMGIETEKPSAATTKCTTCNKIYCQCKEHLDEEATRFLDQLKYQLRNIRKDKSCVTEEVEERKTPQVKQLCIICGHYDCDCKKSTKKEAKHFEFIHLMDDVEPLITKSEKSIEVLTEAQKISQSPLQRMMSGHIREDVCSLDEKINMEVVSLDAPEKSSSATKMATHSHSNKKVSITSKQIKNPVLPKNVLTGPNTKYGIPSAQHAGRYLPSKSVISEDSISEEGKFKSVEMIDKKPEAEKSVQKPLLWYCSDMPQKNEARSPTTFGRKL